MISSLSREALQRLVRVVAGAFATSMTLSGIVVILPLYATRMLGLSNAGFSHVLSLRMIGITLGVLLLGAVSDRFGTQRVTWWSFVAGGICFGLLGFVPLIGFLILIPLLSAFLSTAFVNLNHLTQLVDVQRQGMANTWYRASGTLGGIVAPILMTHYFDHVAWVMAVSGLMLVACGFLVRSYPIEENPQPFQGWGAEFRAMAGQYRLALGQRGLMGFVHTSLVWASLASVVGAFAAIRLTHDLGTSTVFYGNACALGSALTLGAILVLGVWLDRMPIKPTTLGLYAIASACMVVMGLSGTSAVSAAAFVIFIVTANAAISPLSIWISRESGEIGLSLAFTVQKVLSAVYLAAAAFVFGLLEPVMGIQSLFLWCGLLSFAASATMALLRDPPAQLRGRHLR